MGRVKSVYAVLAKIGNKDWQISKYVDDTEAGRKWIKAHGIKGSTYLTVAFRGEPVTVKVDTVEKRTLVAASAEIPAEEPAEEEE